VGLEGVGLEDDGLPGEPTEADEAAIGAPHVSQ